MTNRNWSTDTIAYQLVERPQADAPLPAHPTRVGELGATKNIPAIFPIGEQFSATINAGPQKGVTYWLKTPAAGKSEIFINRIALALNSDFYLLQPKKGGPQGKCLQSDVLPFLPLVEAHEGLQLEPNSHAEAFRRKMNELVPQVTEPVVILGLEFDLVDKTVIVATPAFNAAKKFAGHVDSGGIVAAVPYCTFKYF